MSISSCHLKNTRIITPTYLKGDLSIILHKGLKDQKLYQELTDAVIYSATCVILARKSAQVLESIYFLRKSNFFLRWDQSHSPL